MIYSFTDRETEKIFKREKTWKLPPEIQRTATRKLGHIHVAENINDLRNPPGNHLEKLQGTKNNEYSMRINDQWRICFIWHNNNAYEVHITDYH